MNITVRNIPDEVIKKIRTLSKIRKRSINNEILLILERGIGDELEKTIQEQKSITKMTQINIWQNLANEWDDNRTTEEIINDIYNKRTLGRNIKL
jgi:plasmid stability protein